MATICNLMIVPCHPLVPMVTADNATHKMLMPLHLELSPQSTIECHPFTQTEMTMGYHVTNM
jgi:hypothetical protein